MSARMGKRYSGKIIEFHKNHGMVETMIRDHKVKLFFNVLPSMLDSKGKSTITENVSFETRNMTWHDINIVCAYDLKNEGGSLVQISSQNIKEKDFSRFLFASLRPNSIPGKNTLDSLINAEKQVSLFYLKWILYIEKTTKSALAKAIELIGESSAWLISKLKENSSTKKIIKNALEGVKEKTWLMPTSDFVSFSPKDNDPNDVTISSAPIELLLSTVTLGELSDILIAVFPELSTIKEINSDLYTFLWYAEGLLPDLSIIRNAAAHGNAITPLMIDDTISPAYFYEMADVKVRLKVGFIFLDLILDRRKLRHCFSLNRFS